jgi:hypothetical protein
MQSLSSYHIDTKIFHSYLTNQTKTSVKRNYMACIGGVIIENIDDVKGKRGGIGYIVGVGWKRS